MEQNYTQENLIQFIYRENPITDQLEFENALETNTNLKSRYKEIKAAIRKLPKVSFYPSKSVIDNILKYSQISSLEAQL